MYFNNKINYWCIVIIVWIIFFGFECLVYVWMCFVIGNWCSFFVLMIIKFFVYEYIVVNVFDKYIEFIIGNCNYNLFVIESLEYILGYEILNIGRFIGSYFYIFLY